MSSIVDDSLPGGKSFVEEAECVDVSKVAKDMGFRTPVLFSPDLHEKCFAVSEVDDHLKDVLWHSNLPLKNDGMENMFVRRVISNLNVTFFRKSLM